MFLMADGTVATGNVFAKVPLPERAVAIGCGRDHFMAITENQSFYSWTGAGPPEQNKVIPTGNYYWTYSPYAQVRTNWQQLRLLLIGSKDSKSVLSVIPTELVRIITEKIVAN